MSPVPYSCQFWERCKLFLMPAKHQPDHAFLRHVPLRRIHLFTLVQILCLALLWILKSSVAAIIFPVMVRREWASLVLGSAARRFSASERGRVPKYQDPAGTAHMLRSRQKSPSLPWWAGGWGQDGRSRTKQKAKAPSVEIEV